MYSSNTYSAPLHTYIETQTTPLKLATLRLWRWYALYIRMYLGDVYGEDVLHMVLNEEVVLAPPSLVYYHIIEYVAFSLHWPSHKLSSMPIAWQHCHCCGT